MIFFTIVTIIFLFYYKKYYKETGLSPLLIFVISLFLLSLFSFEFILGEIKFFASDEIYYINAASDKLPPDFNRFLWVFTNDVILNYDISFNGFALKLINIPIAACFLIVLWAIFKNKKIFLIPVVLPYFAFIATKDVRDISIFLFTALTILLFHHRKPIYMVLSLISLVMLFLLRPFAAVIVFIILLVQICLLMVRPLKRLVISKRLLTKILILATMGLIVSPVVVPVVRHSIVKHYNWFIYTTFAEGYEMKIERGVQGDPKYASGNRVKDFCVACVRYAVTPIPTSIFGRLMKGGSEQWGLADDLIRIVNQIGYYVLLGYLMINVRSIWPLFRQMSAMGRAFILCLLTYWPIYSFHLYGVTHQRLKLPLQITIFLVVISVSEYKRNKHTRLIKKRTPCKIS
jgi:hypothetical protein